MLPFVAIRFLGLDSFVISSAFIRPISLLYCYLIVHDGTYLVYIFNYTYTVNTRELECSFFLYIGRRFLPIRCQHRIHGYFLSSCCTVPYHKFDELILHRTMQSFSLPSAHVSTAYGELILNLLVMKPPVICTCAVYIYSQFLNSPPPCLDPFL